MNESKIAVRYSKALFHLAKEKNLIDTIQSDMELMANILKESEEFKFFFFSPINRPSLKSSTLDLLFGKENINPITINFLKILVQKNRFHYLTDITRNFIDFCRNFKGIKSVHFQTVFEPDDNIKKRISEILKNFYKAEIELQVNTNSELIGGFLLRINDQQYDASIATALKKMKSEMKES